MCEKKTKLYSETKIKLLAFQFSQDLHAKSNTAHIQFLTPKQTASNQTLDSASTVKYHTRQINYPKTKNFSKTPPNYQLTELNSPQLKLSVFTPAKIETGDWVHEDSCLCRETRAYNWSVCAGRERERGARRNLESCAIRVKFSCSLDREIISESSKKQKRSAFWSRKIIWVGLKWSRIYSVMRSWTARIFSNS